MTAVPAAAALAAAVELVKRFEGCRLAAYPDPGTGGAPWTCGWGATGPDVLPGTVWTRQQADARLLLDLGRFADAVDRLAEVPLTDGQKAALVSFAYNVGVSALGSSSLLRLLNAGLAAEAAEQFPRWNMAAGKVMNGLKARRAAEQKLFMEGTK